MTSRFDLTGCQAAIFDMDGTLLNSMRFWRLTGLEYLNNQLYVTGSGFTPYSVVNINDDDAKTVFVDSTTLIALVDEPEAKSVVTVSQVGNDRGVLSTTMPRIYNPAGQ